MSHGIWGQPRTRENRAFHEKLFRRAPLPPWEARWQGLSISARSALLHDVKGTGERAPRYYGQANRQSVKAKKFDPRVLEELKKAGFVEVEADDKKPGGDRVLVVEADGIADFISRVRALRRYHLLVPDLPSMLSTYINACYSPSDLLPVIHGLLREVGIDNPLFRIDDVLVQLLTSSNWPDWVAKALKDPLAGRVLSEVRKAEGPIFLDDLPGRVAGASPEEVRASLDRLIAHLALFEDLDPKTLRLHVGLLPAVREAMALASQARKRPPLLVCESPREFGPDESVAVGDLRAFLLEVASEPPRLRQDLSLFQKEIARFQEVLEPLPTWFAGFLGLSSEKRLFVALRWAQDLKLVKEALDGKVIHLHLLPVGMHWLTGSVEEQNLSLIAPFRAPYTLRSLSSTGRSPSLYETSYYDDYTVSDGNFLGVNLAAFTASKGKRNYFIYDVKAKDYEPLRDSLDRVFSALPLGTFYRLDSLAEHAAFGPHNPLLLGESDWKKVLVYEGNRALPPLENRLEETGRRLIEGFVRERLIPLGCVRTAVDDQGKLCIARESMLDAYFGRKVAPDPRNPRLKATTPDASRVVVQPDFSIVIIGPNPAPAAELLPFCERASRGSGRGAVVLKLTREAVIRGVSHGLEAAEIVKRLKRHASHEVPANVLREVQDWANWVRTVTPEDLTVLRCPDRETADRIMGVLRKQGERLLPTLIAFAPGTITAVDRHKLKDQGVILSAPIKTRVPGSVPRAKKKTRRPPYYD